MRSFSKSNNAFKRVHHFVYKQVKQKPFLLLFSCSFILFILWKLSHHTPLTCESFKNGELFAYRSDQDDDRRRLEVIELLSFVDVTCVYQNIRYIVFGITLWSAVKYRGYDSYVAVNKMTGILIGMFL